MTSWQGKGRNKFWSFPNTTGGYGEMVIIGAYALVIASIAPMQRLRRRKRRRVLKNVFVVVYDTKCLTHLISRDL